MENTQSDLHKCTILMPSHAVIYSVDHEPISYIRMLPEFYDYFSKYEIVKFPVRKPMTFKELTSINPIADTGPLYAEIRAMRLRIKDTIRLMLYTNNEETALLLANDFLPGQTKEINLIKGAAIMEGIALAIRKLRDTND